MSATPEREQAEALRDVREFLAWYDEMRSDEYHEHLGDAYREMARVYRAFVAAVERAEKAERERDEAREIVEQLRRYGGDWIVAAAVERERELTRALADVRRIANDKALGHGELLVALWKVVGRGALAGGVSAAGRPPEQDLGGNAVARAEAGQP